MPATAPTTQRARRAVVIPPGFHTVMNTQGASRTAICEPADDAWVTEALNGAAAATRPTTMPDDLITRLGEKRDLFKGRVAADLAINDAAVIDRFYDATLIPQIRQIAAVDPPIFYLVCTRDRLKELMRNGWQEPRFYYNRVADDVTFDPDLRMSDEGPMDDVVMPAVYFASTTPEQRKDQLKLVVSRNERAILDAVSRRAQVITQLAVIDFIQKQAFEPLKLRDDQQWFAMGIEAVLSCKYMTDLAGVRPDELLARVMRDNPTNPMRADSIDLIHPPDKSALRPEWVGAYGDAFRVKSARVVNAWLTKAGDGAASLTLVSLRASPPADGAGLVRLIHQTTGVDLNTEVKAK